MTPQDLAAGSSRVQAALMKGGFPSSLEGEVRGRLLAPPFRGAMVAVRSSGTDEDSAAHSFAGMCACSCVHLCVCVCVCVCACVHVLKFRIIVCGGHIGQ